MTFNEPPLSPEINISCPKCKTQFNPDAIYRLYRAYLTLTRYSRATSYKVVCSVCAKHTNVRVPPINPDSYKCRRCSFRAEKEGKIGYKRNPLANQRIT